MNEIIFKGWEVGMRGIPFMFLLQDKAGISLKEAKDIKERVVNNEIIKISVFNSEIAEEIITEARKLGVICDFQ